MTRLRTFCLIGAVFALGLLLVVIGALVDPAGFKGVAWNSDMVVRGGTAPPGVAPTPGEDEVASPPVWLTLEEYQNRVSWAMVSGVLTCAGLLALAAGLFLLMNHGFSHSWMLPETPEGRARFKFYLGVLLVLGLGAVCADMMGHKLSGTGVETRLETYWQGYYAVPWGGGLRMPISEAQYHQREDWHRASLDVFFVALVAVVPFAMYLAAKGFVSRLRRDLRP